MANEVARILVADLDKDLCAIVSYSLEAAGFVVECVAHGADVEDRIASEVIDLLITELILPGISGLELCRRLRERDDTMSLPIIVISEQNEERDRVRALTMGADDYLGKPFSLAELTARVVALLRRSAFRTASDRVVMGDIAIDLSNRRVSRYGRLIHLGPLEYGLLAYLIQRPGQVFSRSHLLERVWPGGIEVITRTVDVNIGRLRKALSYDSERDPILTVRGEGYAFDETFDRDRSGHPLRSFVPPSSPSSIVTGYNQIEEMDMSSKSKPSDKPAGLLHIVIYHDNDVPAAAAFTSREMADAFADLRWRDAPQSERSAAYSIVEVVVDANAVGTPPNE